MTLGVQEPWDSEFDLTGLPTGGFPEKETTIFLRIFHKLLGLDVPFYLLGGLVHCSYMGFLLGFGEGGGRCKNDISTLHHFDRKRIEKKTTLQMGGLSANHGETHDLKLQLVE